MLLLLLSIHGAGKTWAWNVFYIESAFVGLVSRKLACSKTMYIPYHRCMRKSLNILLCNQARYSPVYVKTQLGCQS